MPDDLVATVEPRYIGGSHVSEAQVQMQREFSGPSLTGSPRCVARGCSTPQECPASESVLPCRRDAVMPTLANRQSLQRAQRREHTGSTCLRPGASHGPINICLPEAITIKDLEVVRNQYVFEPADQDDVSGAVDDFCQSVSPQGAHQKGACTCSAPTSGHTSEPSTAPRLC